MEPEDDLSVLRRGLEQLANLLRQVDRDALDRGTPCHEWTVRQLVDHIVAAPARFARMTRGEPIDWSAPTPAAGADPGGAFSRNADDLMRAWAAQRGPAEGPGVAWLCAELAVHTWDLATARDRPTADLDPEVAERGLAFMRSNLTADRRAPAFGPEQHAPDGADAYQRIAAFAGRRV
jgi:uncharacterized protein (TIGR03086 family)